MARTKRQTPADGAANGAAEQPQPKRRGRPRKTHAESADPAQPAIRPDDTAEPDQVAPPHYRPASGRLASEIEPRGPTWLVPGLIPIGALTFVVGDPGAGKSSLGAWLCGQAKRPAILPGQEEDVACALVPRLRANGADLERTLILDDRLWSLPSDRRALAQILIAHQCDLLWIDPVDSYIGECGENDGQGVRTALESLAAIAVTLQIPVVAARHPGKTPGNICPGSRAWRAVPREIIELRYDAGPPEQRVLRLRRDPYSQGTRPRAFALTGPPGLPKRVELAAVVSDDLAASMAISDQCDRWKVDEAVEFLRAVLADGAKESVWIYVEAEKQRLGERTVRYAARRIGVEMTREGSGREHVCRWALPDSGTPAK